MAKARLLLTMAFVGCTATLPVHAQAPSPAPAATTGNAWQADFLQALPRPPSQPQSLFTPPPPPAPPPPDLERPFFAPDPILDPPQWPQPGWFTVLQVDAIHPHVWNEMVDTVTTSLGTPVRVALGNARLNWTVAPRIQLGYRLPSGFGELSVAYRSFSTQGTDTVFGPDGPATRTSRLAVNYTDFDYGSREYTPLDNWGMKWHFGVRWLYTYLDTRVDEPFAQAAAGSGVFAEHATNWTSGVGPHAGVELDRCIGNTGLAFVNRVDASSIFTRIRQQFSAATTTLTSAGLPSSGVLSEGRNQGLPTIFYQTGLGWQPPAYPNTHLFLGYTYEIWWNVMRNSSTASRGYFNNQGVVLQAGFNF